MIEAMRGALACLRRSTCERLPTDARPNTCVTSRHICAGLGHIYICAGLGHICAGTGPDASAAARGAPVRWRAAAVRGGSVRRVRRRCGLLGLV